MLPRSLFGRLLLLLLGGLLLTQLLSAVIQFHDRGQILYQAVGGDIAQRIAAIVELLDESAPSERRRLVAALDLPPTRISLHLPWREPGPDGNASAPLITAVIRRQLGDEWPMQVAVFSGPDDMPPDMGPDPFGERRFRRYGHWLNSRAFVVQVRLKDGSVVTFRHRVPEDVFAWPYRVLLILAILFVSVWVLSALAVRWVTRPLALLATAATELGRNLRRPPLAESGPTEVRQAAQAFNNMQARLLHYIDERSRVLAAVSHDLKTPITRLRVRTELLDKPELQEKFQNDLDDMEAMVQATLDFMRGTEFSEALVPIDINALLESLQEDTGDAGGAVTLEGQAVAPWVGRPLALKRCLTNLINNAVQYGQQATVLVQDSPDRLQLVIRDAGPGMPEAELEKVFEPFYRLEGSRNRHTGGTGLGLSIARNIARAHGGELVLRNAQTGGLEAVLNLPR
ncbi:MAG: HAMP domain-containing protein [Gammaproteobacteria bacterium]|nr:HAMP domain-containing protein [Gammaproteobacteria bacterium]MCP5425408.1 HAMP domain-containing protein [Gammaproteobacteria bacterium]MCP5459264.1 HAMP domain-containing protein [Gammaproteobacteria bacterium]